MFGVGLDAAEEKRRLGFGNIVAQLHWPTSNTFQVQSNRLAEKETFDLWAVSYFVCEINRWWEREADCLSVQQFKKKRGLSVHWKVARLWPVMPVLRRQMTERSRSSSCLECVTRLRRFLDFLSWNFPTRRFTIYIVDHQIIFHFVFIPPFSRPNAQEKKVEVRQVVCAQQHWVDIDQLTGLQRQRRRRRQFNPTATRQLCPSYFP